MQSEEGATAVYRALLENAAIGIERTGADGRILDVNDALCGALGYTREELVGRNHADITHPDDLDAERAGIGALFAGDRPEYTIEKRCLAKDGSSVWVRAISLLARTAPDEPRYRVSIIENITGRRRTEGELRESAQTLSAIISEMSVGIAQVDLDGRFVLANDCYCTILGRPREELLNLRMQDVTHPDDMPGNMPLFARTAEHGIPFVIEKRYVRPDGSFAWVSNSVSAVRDREGKPRGVLAVAVDISARKAAEERQRLLIREVDHRAKNALAVVQALVRLTPRASPDAFVKAVEGRVSALARTHTLLADNNWSGVALSELVEAELAPYTEGERRIAFAGPPVALGASAVQPFGMIVHELATNAAKHGSLSVPAGRLDVSWGFDTAAGDFVFSWVESGTPLATGSARRGFGSTLIERNVSGALAGVIRNEWSPTGLHCTVRIPVHHVGAVNNAQASPGTSVPQRPVGHDELAGLRVLIVEDEVLLALSLQEMLASLGCKVTAWSSTLVDAIRRASFESFDAALLDVNMGGLNVHPVAEVLKERGLPFILTTGYEELDWDRATVPVIRKPFRTEDVGRALRRLLARGTGSHDDAKEPPSGD
ncbi:MAG TPA: PAS domain S-box protein [Arenibaculum sp.]|nr:PAS domain S-box protein [Arenibaculum sp.]